MAKIIMMALIAGRIAPGGTYQLRGGGGGSPAAMQSAPKVISNAPGATSGRGIVVGNGNPQTALSAVGQGLVKTPIGIQQSIISPQMQYVFDNPAQAASANVFPIPRFYTITVASATGAGAAATDVYLYNSDAAKMNNNATNNGSGASTITYTHQDNFGSRNMSNLMGQSRLGVGIICLGVSMRFNVTSSGAGSPASIATGNPKFIAWNGYGDYIPTNLNSTADQTRGDEDTSIQVYTCVCNMGEWTQFKFNQAVGITTTLTFSFTPDFKV